MVIATIESFLVAVSPGMTGRHTRQRETFGRLWDYETTTASKANCFNVEVASDGSALPAGQVSPPRHQTRLAERADAQPLHATGRLAIKREARAMP
jgi:hypothetical protein